MKLFFMQHPAEAKLGLMILLRAYRSDQRVISESVLGSCMAKPSTSQAIRQIFRFA
jgi:hypothetical protein